MPYKDGSARALLTRQGNFLAIPELIRISMLGHDSEAAMSQVRRPPVRIFLRHHLGQLQQ